MFDETKCPSAVGWSRVLFFLGVLTITQTTWRPALAFTLSDWIFLAAFLSIVPVWLMYGKWEFPLPTSLLVGLGLILLGGLLSTPSAIWPLSSLYSLTKLCYLMVVWFSLGIILLRKH